MTVLVMHPDPATREALRRGTRGRRLQIVSCRTFDRVEKLVNERLVDAIVVNLPDVPMAGVVSLRSLYPAVPLFGFGAARPDDGRRVAACHNAGVHILVEGVDEPIAGETVSNRSAAAVRERALADAPALLGLTEPIQLRTWEEILVRVGSVIRTSQLAAVLGVSREHLSREFAAGDAPNLKRVIDLARISCAAQMLANPGYTVEAVARILGYSSASHLAGTATRVAGLRPAALAAVGPRGALQRFSVGRTRSRL